MLCASPGDPGSRGAMSLSDVVCVAWRCGLRGRDVAWRRWARPDWTSPATSRRRAATSPAMRGGASPGGADPGVAMSLAMSAARGARRRRQRRRRGPPRRRRRRGAMLWSRGHSLHKFRFKSLEKLQFLEQPHIVEQPLFVERPKDVEQAQRCGIQGRSAILVRALKKNGCRPRCGTSL